MNRLNIRARRGIREQVPLLAKVPDGHELVQVALKRSNAGLQDWQAVGEVQDAHSARQAGDYKSELTFTDPVGCVSSSGTGSHAG